jgi:hypothetical protein
MAICKVNIIPGAGWYPSGYSRGHAIDSIAEVDAIDIVVHSLEETLSEFMLHAHVMPTRKKPGMSDTDREMVEPCCCSIDLGLSWFDRKRQNNESEIEAGCGVGMVASAIGEALTEWGRCCSFGHRTQRPRGIGTPGLIRIKLFALNGPDADVYLGRLVQVGREIGLAVAGSLK